MLPMRAFIDTHVLVHADAGDEPAKQATAIRRISKLRRTGNGMVSTQLLHEYANVALRNKLRLPPALVRDRLRLYVGFDVVPTSPDMIQQALDLHIAHGIAFYDALIVQAAMGSGAAGFGQRICRPGASSAA